MRAEPAGTCGLVPCPGRTASMQRLPILVQAALSGLVAHTGMAFPAERFNHHAFNESGII